MPGKRKYETAHLMLKFLKYLILGVAAFLLQSYFSIPEQDNPNHEDRCTSYVTVKGSSNVNHFSFNNTNPIIKDSAEFKTQTEHYQTVQIPVRSFTSPNTHMINDFLNLIKASEYPNITLALEPRDLMQCERHTEPTKFKTKITIAGTTNVYVVPCKVTACDKNEYLVEGNLEIKLTEFHLNPPKKFFGMIRVNNEVSINYAFTFHPGNNIFK